MKLIIFILIILIIFAILLFIRENYYKKDNKIENFITYFEEKTKYKHKIFYNVILKNKKKTNFKNKADLIIKNAFSENSFKNIKSNNIITGNMDINKIDYKDVLWYSVLKKHGFKNAINILPESRILKNNNYLDFIKHNKNDFFILKKNVEDGKGLFISKNKKVLTDKITSELDSKKPYVIIQKIIKNPYLIDKKSFKIRIYLIITCKNNNIKFYLSRSGYIAYSKNNWNPKKINYKNVMASPHWNEDYLLKNKGNFKKNIKKLIDNYKNKPIFLSDFKKYMLSKGIDYDRKIHSQLRHKMKMILKSINFNKKYNSVIVSGIDIVLDNKLNLYIIEINRSPGTTPYNFIKNLKDKEFNEKIKIYNDSFHLMFPKKFRFYNSVERLNL
jgi:hypothetical protein